MQADIAIIGSGGVGLATALRLNEARPDLRIVVLEKEPAVALHQTGHNSGVIHSGIYYTPGSLKARNCTAGYAQLLEFCRANEIPHKLCGKVIVATDEAELPALERIHERGLANGLDRIRKIGPEELREIEPHAAGIAAIHVPYAGIVDYARVCQVYAQLLEERGAEIRTSARVESFAQSSASGTIVRFSQNGSAQELATRLVINCAGLHCDTITEAASPRGAAKNNPDDFRIIPFRGEYYERRPERRHLVKTLIYPVPDPAFPFLGVHFTSLIHGGVEAGPNAVLAFKKEGYRWRDISLRDTARTFGWPGFRSVARRYWRTGLSEMHRSLSKSAFTRALQKLIPEIQSNDLLPGGAGVRAQACARGGGLIDDFLFREAPGFIHVGNAPSPAATSSLAIGQRVAEMAVHRLSST